MDRVTQRPGTFPGCNELYVILSLKRLRAKGYAMLLRISFMAIAMIIFFYFCITHPIAVLLSQTGMLKKLH